MDCTERCGQAMPFWNCSPSPSVHDGVLLRNWTKLVKSSCSRVGVILVLPDSFVAKEGLKLSSYAWELGTLTCGTSL